MSLEARGGSESLFVFVLFLQKNMKNSPENSSTLRLNGLETLRFVANLLDF